MATALGPATESPINTEEKPEDTPESSDKSDTKTDLGSKTDSDTKTDTKSDSEDKKVPEDDSATRAFECNICLDTG